MLFGDVFIKHRSVEKWWKDGGISYTDMAGNFNSITLQLTLSTTPIPHLSLLEKKRSGSFGSILF